MASFIKVVLMGNITRTPDVRNIPGSSTVVATTGIAVNRKIKDKEEVMFIDIVTYGKLAEIMGRFVTKGMPILVEGRLTYRSWEQDGQKRSKHEVVADSFQMLGGNRDRDDFNESVSCKNDAGLSRYGGMIGEDDVPF